MAPFVVRRPRDHHRLDHRVAEPSSRRPGRRRRRGGRARPARAHSSRPVPLDAAKTPRSPEPSSTASRSRRRVDSGSRSILASYRSAPPGSSRRSRCARGRCREDRRPTRRTPATPAGLPCASSTTSRRTRVGRCANWRASRSIASASDSGATSNSVKPARSKNPPDSGSGRTQQSDPAAREPPAHEPDDRTACAIQPVHVVDDDEQRGADAASRNSASDALNTARRSGAGPDPMPRATSSATRAWTGGAGADRRTTGRRADAGRRS